MASRRTQLNDLTVLFQTTIKHQNAVASTAQIDLGNLRHEIDGKVRFQASARRNVDWDEKLSHSQELYHDLAVQESARYDVMAPLPD